MTIALLQYPPSAQNTRVQGFEIPGDEQPIAYSTTRSLDNVNQVIEAAYLQIFHEQQMLSFCRQTFLESQLRNGRITVKDFIKGLVTSDIFRRLNYEVNNNYRFVEICVQRLLGRQVYNEREKLSWSVVLATQGLQGFITQLLDSDEYRRHFGDHTVPYQRRRVLPQRAAGEQTFAHTARYGPEYRDKLASSQPFPTFGAGGRSFNIGSEEKRLLLLALCAATFAALWLIL